ncbi:MAG: hypothetical protein GF384_05800, partial [Elusimicrobia bacterium]|nr:hypothetical protein [Elusimicrobiota bacterium]MBD3412272.1 hypothetical protein [Elusimicrobiota bacterium]
DMVEQLLQWEGLSEKERTILELHDLQGMAMKDVGEMLNISESRVSQVHKQLLARARKFFARRGIHRPRHTSHGPLHTHTIPAPNIVKQFIVQGNVNQENSRILKMYYLEGKTDAQIAATFGLSDSAIGQRRKVLLKLMRQFCTKNNIPMSYVTRKSHGVTPEEVKQFLAQVNLNEQDTSILTMYYLDGKTDAQIAEEFDVTGSHIGELRRRLVQQIRESDANGPSASKYPAPNKEQALPASSP